MIFQPTEEHNALNRGYVAWSQVAAAFLMSMCSLGLANAFGIFQSYYQNDLLASSSPSAIAWIGTTQGFLVNVLGLASGRLYDSGYIKSLLYTGMLLNTLGLLGASFARTYASVFVSLGVCVGVGSGLFYVPSLAIVASYFTTRLPVASGLSATGASIGGVIYPLLFRGLIDHIGSSWTFRIFAFINGSLLSISCLIIRPRTVSRTSRKLLDISAFHDAKFLLFSMSLFLLWLAVDVPFFYVPSFVQFRLHLKTYIGDDLLSGMNASSILGRILLGLLAVYKGPILAWQFAIGSSCVLLAVWSIINSLEGLIALIILYGFFTGGVISLVSSALLDISPDLAVVGTRLGMCSVFAGLGFLIGPPIAGAIQKSTSGFVGQGVFAGSSYLLAFFLMCLVCYMKRQAAKPNAGLMGTSSPEDGQSLSLNEAEKEKVEEVTVVVEEALR